jgi:hypothetical protein
MQRVAALAMEDPSRKNVSRAPVRGFVRGSSSRQGRLGGFNGGFVDEHDGNVILDSIDAVTVRAFQCFGILAICEGSSARGADQDVQELFGDHGENCTREQDHGIGGSVRFSIWRRNDSSNSGWRQDRE